MNTIQYPKQGKWKLSLYSCNDLCEMEILVNIQWSSFILHSIHLQTHNYINQYKTQTLNNFEPGQENDNTILLILSALYSLLLDIRRIHLTRWPTNTTPAILFFKESSPALEIDSCIATDYIQTKVLLTVTINNYVTHINKSCSEWEAKQRHATQCKATLTTTILNISFSFQNIICLIYISTTLSILNEVAMTVSICHHRVQPL